MSVTAADDVLLTTLEVAVPMHMWEVRDWPEDRRRAAARKAAQAIAEKGDVLMFGPGAAASKRAREHVAETFNHLARGLAIAAHQPGGVTFAGRHWCAFSHPYCPARRRRPECCTCGEDCGETTTEPVVCHGCRWCRNGCVAALGRPCCMAADGSVTDLDPEPVDERQAAARSVEDVPSGGLL